MHRSWNAALSTAIVLSLLAATLPAHAKQSGERRGRIQIEAKEELAVDTASSRSAKSELVIIQLSGPVREDWKEEIEGTGVTLGDYIPDYAFLAKLGHAQDKKKLERLSFVEKVTPYTPVSKVAPSLRSALGGQKAVQVAVVGFDRKVNMRHTVNSLSVMNSVQDLQIMDDAKHISVATMSGQDLEEVIQSEDVIAVVPVPENKLHNDVAAAIIHADELASSGYTGEGQIVGVADTGLDTGREESMHPDFQGQIKNLYAIGRAGDPSDQHGHGTHVAGSILGTGAASDGKYKGMAPKAKLVFHAIESEEGLKTDVKTILSQAYEDGARIHSDSWGDDDNGEYSLTSFLFDQFLWEHPDMTALVAAGNDGKKGYQSIGSPATAKNVIAVGATENDRPDLGTESNDIDDVWKFSSRGLTSDGRIKPDLVAPGTSIISTRSALAPSKNFDQRVDNRYAYMTGTSMATAIMAGGVAQIRQFLDERGEKEPSGALLKAILLSSAEELDEDMRLQGYGRANLTHAIETSYKDEKKGIKTRDKVKYSVKVTDDSKPLAITLAWTDYPSALVAKRALVNDLNLTVTTPSGEKLNGNDFFEAPYDDEVDNLNNVEQIWIKEPEKGIYTVTVQGYNIPKGPQPYALATTGKWATAEEPDPGQEPEQPGTGANTYVGNVNESKPTHSYKIRALKQGLLTVSLDWAGDADVDVYVYDRQKKEIASAVSSNHPEKLEVELSKTGIYEVSVVWKKGSKANYKLWVSYPTRK
ncbi:S8 family serine peptidase [Brevibacillus choshinensis]|uniref:S8 family serine peptidase n=1 Tax=Brevibacillus choshinensis TaxID=54911 RepID=A0ABX7FGK6_BRECH|nr:S8 family serine peptidase [Brevibacillus choshinensis]QRG65326.1 S8 family serine peptidase [Brevibacillus choshinensis]